MGLPFVDFQTVLSFEIQITLVTLKAFALLLGLLVGFQHNALIPSVPYTDFEILNLTSQTVFIVFLGLLYDFGATPIPCFVDYFTVEPSRAKSHFTQSSLKDVCKYFSLIFNRFVTKLLLLTKATLLQW